MHSCLQKWNKMGKEMRTDHQSVLADNEQALGPVDLSQANFFIEGAVASDNHGDAVWEAALWDLGGRAQRRRGQVVDLKARLKTKRCLCERETALFHLCRTRPLVTYCLVEVLRQPCPLRVEEDAVVLSVALFFVAEMGHAILPQHLSTLRPAQGHLLIFHKQI